MFCALNARAQLPEVPLWKEGAPGIKHDRAESVEDRAETGRLDRWIGFVSNPTLTIYPAEGAKASGAAVLVVPGGGFRYVCIDKEGHEAARWLNSLGVTAAVLKYRVLDPSKERTPEAVEPIFVDTERAMRVLRHGAAGWKIDPKRIGIMGFSAGGVMAVRQVFDADEGNAAAADPVEQVSSRPDFVALVYSGLPPGKIPKVQNIPPCFIVHASDDPKAPVAVASKVFNYIIEAGGSAELHAFRRGDHGFGVLPKAGTVRAWTTLYADWMRDLKLIAD